MRAPAWIATPLRLPISLSGRPFSPSCLILALLAAILAHLGARRAHLVAKLLQDGAQMTQHSAKMGQHGLQEGSQIQEKPLKVMNSRRFFGFRPFWQDRAQDTKKVTKMLPKARQVGSKFASLGTSWRQVGQHSVILAPTWPILVPRCAPTGIHMEPQMPPNSHLAPSWRQEGPQSAPRQPQGSIFSYFLPFWERFWTDVCSFSISILIEFRNRFCLRCLIFFFNFCFQSPVLKSQVSARWRLVARSALDK